MNVIIETRQQAMARHYKIDLSEPAAEAKHPEGTNIASVSIVIDGKAVPSQGCTAAIALSRTAMFSLGEALIRAASREPESRTVWEIEPIRTGFAVESFGLFLHPNSCRLVIMTGDFGHVANLEERQ